MKITGLFKASTEAKQITEKFMVQNFFLDLDTDKEYPTIGQFQINNGRLDISHLKSGDEVTVHFNISGRKWEKDGRSGFAQNLVCWKIETETTAPVTPKVEPTSSTEPESSDDGLPF